MYDGASRSWVPLVEQVTTAISSPEYSDAEWAVLIYDIENDKPIFGWNEYKNMIPASNTKLYTTAAALDQLGPDFQYETHLISDGNIADGVLQGNLYVVGSGDPVIGGRYNDGNIVKTFEDWADSLKALGIQKVAGDIIGDDDYFDDIPLGPGWMWDDESYWYSAEVSALSLNDNTVDIIATGTREGQPARIHWEPSNTPYVTVFNNTVSVHPDSSGENNYSRRRANNIIDVSSEVPVDRTVTRYVTISNPTQYFVTVLSEVLERKGISIEGTALDVDRLSSKPDYAEANQRVAVHLSVPMSEIVKAINKPSHNLYADMVLKTLAAESSKTMGSKQEGSWKGGIEQVKHTLAKAGADTSRTMLVDGSGLSRYNLVTADMTIDLLRYMWHHPDRQAFSAFYESLPIGGVDGTLSGRYAAGSARGNVRAKTGTVSYASSLSGYVQSADGKPVAFSIMANHFSVPTSQVRATQDFIVEQLANMQLTRD